MITWGSACDPCESGQSQPQAFDEIIRKRHFLSPEAPEPGEYRPGAAGTISATTEERLTEKVAYTEAEEPNIELGQIPDGIFEHLDQAMSEAVCTPRLLVMGTINSLLKNSGLSVCHLTTISTDKHYAQTFQNWRWVMVVLQN